MEVTGATMVDTMASDLLMLVLMPMPMLTIEATAMAGTAVVTMAGTVDMAMADMAMVVVTMADCIPCCKSFGLTNFYTNKIPTEEK